MTDKQSNTAFDDKVKDVLKNYECWTRLHKHIRLKK
jgi:hypothetical protein